MNLANFDIDTFRRDFWQQKPLLIRGAWPDWQNPLAPDELAGLACEEDIEARLIVAKGKKPTVEHGPFAPERFAKLGKNPWTLLVQAVDHYVPDVAALIAPFRFIPNWRIDDVMVSYASDGGGVGPHFDQYDVFLVQGLGQRRWRVGAPCDHDAALLPHGDLRLLERFDATDEWVLNPGDVLYVPPRVPHDGVAVGDDCMTYSIGFRAPSRSDLISNWCDHLLDGLDEDDRYGDPGLAAQANPGEISAEALDRLHAMVAQKLADRDAFARWFGQHNSAPKNAEIDWRPEEPVEIDDLREMLAEGAELSRNPASRFSFVRRDGGRLWLFADGETYDCEGQAAQLAEQFCVDDSVTVEPGEVSEDALALIAALINRGCVALDNEADEDDCYED